MEVIVSWATTVFWMLFGGLLIWSTIQRERRRGKDSEELNERRRAVVWIALGDSLDVEVHTNLAPRDAIPLLRSSIAQLERQASAPGGPDRKVTD